MVVMGGQEREREGDESDQLFLMLHRIYLFTVKNSSG